MSALREEDKFNNNLVLKFKQLLTYRIFKDIKLNCNDGTLFSNRLLLSIYSSFLEDIFCANPMIASSHEACRTGDEGINLPDVNVHDLNIMMQSLGSVVILKREQMKRVRRAAKSLKITLKEKSLKNGEIEFEAIPDENVVGQENNICVSEMDEDFKLETRSNVCPFCEITCKSWQGVRRHIGHYHSTGGKNVVSKMKPSVKCKCGVSFSKNAKKLFKDHRKVCLSYIASAFVCDLCQVPFHELPSLNNHKFTVHGITTIPNSCVCGKVLANRHQLRKHFIVCDVYKGKAIFCRECELPFMTTNHLQQHFNSAQHKSNLMEMIAKGLRNESDLKEGETREAQIVMCKCGQNFSKHSRILYREHRRNCSAFLDTAAICDLCNTPFEDMISLTIHKAAVHQINKTSNTCFCEKVFENRNQLRRHQIICEKYKKLAIICEECDLPFPSQSHYQQHLKSSTHLNVVVKTEPTE